MKYLVDTDWSIHYLRGKESIQSALVSLLPDGVGISIISICELYAGLHNSDYQEENITGLKQFLGKLKTIYLNEETADIYGQVYGSLRRKGNLIDGFDMLIAATCLENNLTLLTQNRRHFERIPGLEVYSI